MICGLWVVVGVSVVVATLLGGVLVLVLTIVVVVAGEDWLVVNLMVSVSAIMVVGMRVGRVRMRAVAPDFVGFVTRVGGVTGFGISEKN